MVAPITKHPLKGVLEESTRVTLGRHLVSNFLQIGRLHVGDLELGARLFLENLQDLVLGDGKRGHGQVLVGRLVGLGQNGGDGFADEGEVRGRVGLLSRVEDLGRFVFRVESEDPETEGL